MAIKAETELTNTKSVKAKVERVEATEVPKRMPVDEKVVAVVMVHAYDPLYHPYQRRWVPTADMCPEGVEMPIDSWLQCQIEAGLVKVV